MNYIIKNIADIFHNLSSKYDAQMCKRLQLLGSGDEVARPATPYKTMLRASKMLDLTVQDVTITTKLLEASATVNQRRDHL